MNIRKWKVYNFINWLFDENDSVIKLLIFILTGIILGGIIGIWLLKLIF